MIWCVSQISGLNYPVYLVNDTENSIYRGNEEIAPNDTLMIATRDDIQFFFFKNRADTVPYTISYRRSYGQTPYCYHAIHNASHIPSLLYASTFTCAMRPTIRPGKKVDLEWRDILH